MMIIAIGISKLVGISAGVLTGASMLPQLIKVLKEKKVSQVSVVMLLELNLTAGITIFRRFQLHLVKSPGSARILAASPYRRWYQI